MGSLAFGVNCGIHGLGGRIEDHMLVALHPFFVPKLSAKIDTIGEECRPGRSRCPFHRPCPAYPTPTWKARPPSRRFGKVPSESANKR